MINRPIMHCNTVGVDFIVYKPKDWSFVKRRELRMNFLLKCLWLVNQSTMV